jgi:type IV secretion system protein VirB9
MLTGSAAHADVMPTPSNEDSRIGLLRVERPDLIRLQVMPGNDLTVLLPHGEHVQQVTVGDTKIWHVAVTGEQDALVLSPLRASNAVAMAVKTDRRSYEFALSAANNTVNPYLIRMEAQDTVMNQFRPKPVIVSAPGVQYHLSGQRELYPSSIRDDGHKIYIEWDSSQPIPAVFARDRLGREEMVDGYMRDGVFTLDRLYNELVFRIDKAEAHARRLVRKVKS